MLVLAHIFLGELTLRCNVMPWPVCHLNGMFGRQPIGPAHVSCLSDLPTLDAKSSRMNGMREVGAPEGRGARRVTYRYSIQFAPACFATDFLRLLFTLAWRLAETYRGKPGKVCGFAQRLLIGRPHSSALWDLLGEALPGH